MINIECACGQVIRVSDSYAGEEIRCAKCGKALDLLGPIGTTPGAVAKEAPFQGRRLRPQTLIAAGIGVAAFLGLLLLMKYVLKTNAADGGPDSSLQARNNPENSNPMGKPSPDQPPAADGTPPASAVEKRTPLLDIFQHQEKPAVLIEKPSPPAPAAAPPAVVSAAVDASRSARVGEVEIGLGTVSIQRLQLTRTLVTLAGVKRTEKQVTDTSPQTWLVISLNIKNPGSKPARHPGWRNPMSARLLDASGKVYPPFPLQEGMTIQGQIAAAELQPGESRQDLIAFHKPTSEGQPLVLELDATNFGGTGKVAFRIPAEMIQK